MIMRDTHAAGSIGGLILGAACKQYPHRKVGSDTSNILKRFGVSKHWVGSFLYLTWNRTLLVPPFHQKHTNMQ